MTAYFKPSIKNSDPVAALSGFDEFDISSFMCEEVIRTNVRKMPDNPAKALYLDLDDILQCDNAEEILIGRVAELSSDEMVEYSKILTIRNSAKAASASIAASNAMAAHNDLDIGRMISQAKKKNVSAEQLAKILGTITHWKTGTSHPTQHLSEEGAHLFRDLLNVNNLSAEDRPDALRAAITKMFKADITRTQKMTVREETQTDRAQAKLHRKAQRQTYRNLSAVLKKHYGEDAPNLLDGHIQTTLCYHTWNGGGDCDGKPNADKAALLEGMVGYTLDAIEEHLTDIEKAIELDPALGKVLKNTKASLRTVQINLQQIENKLLNDQSPEFDALKEQYKNVYQSLNIETDDGRVVSVSSEKEMYEHLTLGLRHVVENVANKEAKAVLSDSLFVMRQYKGTFTTAKIESRAPGPVDADIMNALFGDRDFQRAYLDGAMRRLLAGRAFSTLSPSNQMEMMNMVGRKAQKDPVKAKEHYYRIFPKGLDDKGFPNQLRERGERLELQNIHPDKFGMSIVAEAKEMSPYYQDFLGGKFLGSGRMMHTMLNEDMETLDHAADYVIDFASTSGKEAFERAASNDTKLSQFIERYGAMLPCSDSVKQLGPAALFIQAQAINLLMRYAVKQNKTICIKWGNGQVLTRGGGNAHIPGRLKAQAIQFHLNGRALNPDNPDDLKILANAMFASNTEQGRAADFMSANANKISFGHLKMMGEMIGRSLELMGLVDNGTYIKQVSKFSSGSRSVFASVAKNVMMRGYENFRDCVDENGIRLSDKVAELVSNNQIAGAANQASRPDSKAALSDEANSAAAETKLKKGKDLYDLRAIGTTVAISHMRTFHDGWAFDGAGLRSIHEAYINHEISDGDLKEFLKDPLWSAMIKNGLRTASLSDLPHAMKKLGMTDWSHKKAMKVGKSVKVNATDDPKNKPPVLTYKGKKKGVTPEQAYAAKLYYDQALFITYTEKLARLSQEIGPALPSNGQEAEEIREALKAIEKSTKIHLDHAGKKIGRFQIGAYTNKLFPRVDQDRNGNRREMLASQVICDVAEQRFDDLSQEQRFAITAAQRATQTWNNADLYNDQDAYGSKLSPHLEQAWLARLADMDAHMHEALDQSEYGCHGA